MQRQHANEVHTKDYRNTDVGVSIEKQYPMKNALHMHNGQLKAKFWRKSYYGRTTIEGRNSELTTDASADYP